MSKSKTNMLNIFSLYQKSNEKKRLRLEIYNKILTQCHKKIKRASNLHQLKTYFIIPEYFFGVPLYNQLACICYLMITLRKNGFKIQYIHPNLLYISWKIKSKTKSNTLPNKKSKKSNTNIVVKQNNYKSLNNKLISKYNKNDTEQIKYEKNDYNIQELKSVDNNKTVLEQLFDTANFIKCQDK